LLYSVSEWTFTRGDREWNGLGSGAAGLASESDTSESLSWALCLSGRRRGPTATRREAHATRGALSVLRTGVKVGVDPWQSCADVRGEDEPLLGDVAVDEGWRGVVEHFETNLHSCGDLGASRPRLQQARGLAGHLG
jgi:hypothetical protein